MSAKLAYIFSLKITRRRNYRSVRLNLEIVGKKNNVEKIKQCNLS